MDAVITADRTAVAENVLFFFFFFNYNVTLSRWNIFEGALKMIQNFSASNQKRLICFQTRLPRNCAVTQTAEFFADATDVPEILSFSFHRFKGAVNNASRRRKRDTTPGGGILGSCREEREPLSTRELKAVVSTLSLRTVIVWHANLNRK